MIEYTHRFIFLSSLFFISGSSSENKTTLCLDLSPSDCAVQENCRYFNDTCVQSEITNTTQVTSSTTSSPVNSTYFSITCQDMGVYYPDHFYSIWTFVGGVFLGISLCVIVKCIADFNKRINQNQLYFNPDLDNRNKNRMEPKFSSWSNEI